MGDGINDAPALKAADVGISVDSAVDIAKESADIILLEKSLMVLEEGVLEGRKVFANIIKYVRMGASSNFGNMFSVLGASAFLPFVPMAPIQVLTNNLLYDFSQVPIPTDNVDPEQITRPRPWSMDELKKFILYIGPISSIFDYTTYFIMLYVFNCWDPAARSALPDRLVRGIADDTDADHSHHPDEQDPVPADPGRASRWSSRPRSSWSSGCTFPYSPFAASLGFTGLPELYWPLLLVTLLCYVSLTQLVKVVLLRRAWI